MVACFIVVCMGMATGLHAQPKKSKVKKDPEWHGRVDTGLNYYFGNRDLMQFTFRSSLANESQLFEFEFSNRVWFGFSHGERTVNYGTETLKFDYLPQSTLSPFIFLTHTYDEFRSIRGRVDSGIGAKYTFIENSFWDLSISEAVLYEYEKVKNLRIMQESRSSERFKIKMWPSKETYLLYMIFHQPAFDEFWDDYRIIQEFNLTVTLSRHLALTVSFDYEYDNRPAKNVSRHFGAQNTQLTYRF